MPRVLKHLAAFSAYVVLALLFTWPLPLKFATHFLGVRGDDTGIIIWDMWYFRHALTVLKANPLWTDLLYWPYGGNLILTNYTLFNDALAFFLMPLIGMAATWNLIFVLSAALSGYAVLLMLVDWGFAWSAAFVSGAVFAFSPSLTMHLEWGQGLEFACLNAIPFFFWTFSRAIRDGKLRDAALAALCLTWVWTYNYYYFVICALLVPFCYAVLCRPAKLNLVQRPDHSNLEAGKRLVEAALVPALAWMLYAAFWKGQKSFLGQGSVEDILVYAAPYLCFWALAGLRLALSLAPQWRLNGEALRWSALRPYAATLGFWAALNLPMIICVLFFMATGDYATVSRPWRGGGDPVDPLWLAIPSIFHPLWNDWAREWFKGLPFGQPTAVSLGILPLAAAFWLWRRGTQDKWVSLWLAGFAFCFLMTLGPWLKILGVHTYLPMPFYFLHLLPVYNNMQNGITFTTPAALFLALLLAAALKELSGRLPRRAAAWAPALAFCLLAFEFAPGRRTIFSLDAPALIHRFRNRPEGAFLPLPVGAHFPRLIYGMLGTEWLELTSQMVHLKPRVGGFLPRVAKRVYEQMAKDVFFQALLSAQAGGEPAEILKDPKRVSLYFRDMKLSYVLLKTSMIPKKLEEATRRWPMKLIDEDGELRLYSIERTPQ